MCYFLESMLTRSRKLIEKKETLFSKSKTILFVANKLIFFTQKQTECTLFSVISGFCHEKDRFLIYQRNFSILGILNLEAFRDLAHV